MEAQVNININEDELQKKIDNLVKRVTEEHVSAHYITLLIKKKVDEFLKDHIEIAVKEVLLEKNILKTAIRKRLEVKLQKELERQMYAIDTLKNLEEED